MAGALGVAWRSNIACRMRTSLQLQGYTYTAACLVLAMPHLVGLPVHAAHRRARVARLDARDRWQNPIWPPPPGLPRAGAPVYRPARFGTPERKGTSVAPNRW